MKQHDNPVVITGCARTPLGAFQGELSQLSATDLGAVAIKASLQRAGLPLAAAESVLMGCVLPAGLGQAPARQAAIKAGVPTSCSCTTINKMCGSGMKSVMLAHDALLAGSYDTIVAGGMESMSNAPYLLPKARQGYRLGHQRVIDHLFFDGLEDAYEPGRLMGSFADQTAKELNITRQQQDEFALISLQRAQNSARFEAEIVAVNQMSIDEGPRRGKPDKIPQLKPVFNTDGTVTAANASSISDGAAALVLQREQDVTNPLAKIVAHSTHSRESKDFTLAPIGAIESVLQKAAWSIDDVDLFEINEAFAAVTLAAMQALNLSHDKVNVHGGACALGHPIGATGARIIVTLLHALQQRDAKRGIAALCIGGGEATAIAIERY